LLVTGLFVGAGLLLIAMGCVVLFSIDRNDIIFTVFGIGWFVAGGFLMFVGIETKKSPLLTAQAKVFAKTTETSENDIVYAVVIFEFNDRREKTHVDISLYNSIAENDTGLLEYKDLKIFGKRFYFVSFKHD